MLHLVMFFKEFKIGNIITICQKLYIGLQTECDKLTCNRFNMLFGFIKRLDGVRHASCSQ